jgi:hypothetical protein
MAVIGQYADVLLLMAEGRNIPEAEAELHALSGNITALIGFIPGTQPYLVAFDAALQQLKPLIDAAAQRANDREVKRLLVEGAPHVYELIDAMKLGATAMFNGLRQRARSKTFRSCRGRFMRPSNCRKPGRCNRRVVSDRSPKHR